MPCQYRFEDHGLAGLDAQHKGSKQHTATAAVQAKVLRKTLKRPEDGSTHWSCRKTAAASGVSKSARPFRWNYTDFRHRIGNVIAGTGHWLRTWRAKGAIPEGRDCASLPMRRLE